MLADESIKQIRVQKAQRAFDVAAFYEKQQKFKSAKVYYEDLVRSYPETPSATVAKTRLDDLARKEAGPVKSKFWPW